MGNKKTLNLYGERCTPILTKIKKQLESMNVGEILVIDADNQCALGKIRRYCNEMDYFVEIQRIDQYAMRYTIKIE